MSVAARAREHKDHNCATALSRVGVTLDGLRTAGGSVLENGVGYIVGSLAQGFGNGGSDIDIHLLSPDIDAPTPPFLFFVNGVTVDVEHYPAQLPATVFAKLTGPIVDVASGRLAADVVLKHGEAAWLTRWSTALPMDEDSPPMFDVGQHEVVLAHLVRRALSTVLSNWAMAEAVTRSAHDAAHLWSVCGRAVLNLACATRGYPPIGQKWLPARAVKAGVPAELRAATAACANGADVESMLATLGMAGFDPFAVTRVERADDLQPVRIGSQKFALTARGRLESTAPVEGTCAEVIAEHGADHLVTLLSASLSRILVDEKAVAATLTENQVTR
ncbi:hypothetical protein [Actinokineospora sp.]|uniref:hypothetical protein n=1 Tax=Actinokineospora sp. TaxID=1872133 RepID=UPI004037C64E